MGLSNDRPHQVDSAPIALPCTVAILLLVGGCWSPPREVADQTAETIDDGYIFRDVGAAAGLDFAHFNGMSGELYFVEPVGPGGALFDYDNDGDLDVYLVQGAMLPPERPLAEASMPPPQDTQLRDRLLRNDLVPDASGVPQPRLVDVTEASRIDSRGYGMGVAAADYDNDGFNDLYVTNFGRNQLWHNQGDGTFTNVTERSATGLDGWSTSASWFDFDRDGWLDLFVAQYVDFRLANHKTCRSRSGRPDYCGPQSYTGLPDRLLRNRGDGSFEDVTAESGLLLHPSSGLGVISVDLDGDDWLDLYVANDLRRNFLWMNNRDGTFEDRALLAGVAVSGDGKAEASMGIAAADIDNDGDDDLFLTHLMDGTNTLYRNDGEGQFRDDSRQSGLGAASLAFTGFGTAMLDFDNDGWLDIIAFNGSVFRLEELLLAGDPYPLGQRNQLFRNLGDGTFAEVAEAGAAFDLLEVSRGLAVGDIDNDGDSDVLQLNNNGAARLLLNQRGQDSPWLGLRMRSAPDRDALGGRARLLRRDDQPLKRRSHTDGSYCSANDPRVLFGLGGSDSASGLELRWPDGRQTLHRASIARRYLTITPALHQIRKEEDVD